MNIRHHPPPPSIVIITTIFIVTCHNHWQHHHGQHWPILLALSPPRDRRVNLIILHHTHPACAHTQSLHHNSIIYNHSLPFASCSSHTNPPRYRPPTDVLFRSRHSGFRSDILLAASTPRTNKPPRLQLASFDAPWHSCTPLSPHSHSCSCSCCDVLRPTGKA